MTARDLHPALRRSDLLLLGADLIVRGTVGLARRAHVPPVIVALTLVAVGTSLPELIVSVHAALSSYPGIAIGNVVGSNIANVLLVVGAPAIIYPLRFDRGSTSRDSLLLVGISLLFFVLCLTGELGWRSGAILLAGLAGFLGYTLRQALRARKAAEPRRLPEWVLGLPTTVPMIALFLLAGVIGLPVGADLFVNAGVTVADRLGVSDSVIGLTLVAVGTSLPELATALVAAFQRKSEVAVGTVIGSSIFNILGIMGAAAVASPVPVPDGFLQRDLPVMAGAALVLAVLVRRGTPIGRVPGGMLLVAYGVYLLVLIVGPS